MWFSIIFKLLCVIHGFQRGNLVSTLRLGKASTRRDSSCHPRPGQSWRFKRATWTFSKRLYLQTPSKVYNVWVYWTLKSSNIGYNNQGFFRISLFEINIKLMKCNEKLVYYWGKVRTCKSPLTLQRLKTKLFTNIFFFCIIIELDNSKISFY